MAGRPPRLNRWRPLGVLALVVVASVAIALAAIAITRGAEIDPNAEAIPIPELTPTLTEADPIVLPAISRILVPTGTDSAWRSTTLDCRPDSTATIERTEDGGASWTPYPLGEVKATTVLAIDAVDGEGETVGAVTQSGADCAVGYDLSFTGGQFWRDELETPPVPYAPKGASSVVAGVTTFTTDCEAVSGFAVRTGSEAAVLCSDATLHTTADGSVTWQQPDLAGSVLAVAEVGRGYLVATVRDEECTGVRLLVLRPTDGGIEPLSCLTALGETTQVTLAGNASAIWAWIGDQTAVSVDGGMSWPAEWTTAVDPEQTPTPAPTTR